VLDDAILNIKNYSELYLASIRKILNLI
jgi:hypothetical protein